MKDLRRVLFIGSVFVLLWCAIPLGIESLKPSRLRIDTIETIALAKSRPTPTAENKVSGALFAYGGLFCMIMIFGAAIDEGRR